METDRRQVLAAAGAALAGATNDPYLTGVDRATVAATRTLFADMYLK